jgi:glutathione S-transferase
MQYRPWLETETSHVIGNPLQLVGAQGSPYSRKMRAVLRYRRIPFRWIVRGSGADADVPAVPVDLIPVVVFRNGDAPPVAMIDSTFQIRRLEELEKARSIRPADPALAFLDFLIEDYADEWLTKAMFHYRWAFEADAAHAARMLPLDRRLDLDPETHARLAAIFAERQIGRLLVVGSNPTTRPLIEESYGRLLDALDELFRERPFLFGRRPASADFGLFGQLTQLALFDPTSAAIAAERAPRVPVWVAQVDDLSGLDVDEGDWLGRAEIERDRSIGRLLAEIGRTYAPFLLANAAALEAGAEQVVCEIDGAPWQQKPFPYQAKCLRWLREGRSALAQGDRAWVDGVLAGTGCERLFDGARAGR